MRRKPALVPRSDWASSESFWRGRFEGKEVGTTVTILFFSTETIGNGPVWHMHPYDEVFIVRAGNALFTIGDEKLAAEAGQILFGPANVPHKFVNVGPGLLETTDIHLNDRLVQTDLDDPELAGPA